MTAQAAKPITFKAGRDQEGHRIYEISYLVETSVGDGPKTAGNASGLPAIGASWAYGGESDTTALCLPQMEIEPFEQKKNAAVICWKVTKHYGTRPINQCQTSEQGSPLLEPTKISGTFLKFTKEATRDRLGAVLRNSSYEQLRGPQVEFDASRPTVRIEMNIAAINLATFAALIDNCNDDTMWGCAAGCIKLSNVAWEKRYYGTCTAYYNVVYEFEVDYTTKDHSGNIIGFGREVPDMGTKVLNGKWPSGGGVYVATNLDGGTAPNAANPQHYITYRDRSGQPGTVFLNGSGLPLADGANVVYRPVIHHYIRNSFAALGIPATL